MSVMKLEDYLPKKPGHIKVSLTNVCNYKCVMCPNPSIKSPRGFMSDDLAYKIMDQCVEYNIPKISLGSSGEPLLHKNFIKYLEYAKQRKLWVSTSTNCSRLTPELTDGIMRVGIDRINLSVYSSDSQEHKKYCSSDNFDEIVKNVTYFLEQWKRNGSKTHVIMDFLSIKKVNDKDKFLSFWEPIVSKYGLRINVKVALAWEGSYYSKKKIDRIRRFFFDREEGRLRVNYMRKIPCSQMPSYMYILHDGIVHPCCNLLDSADYPEMRFGNINEINILEAWNSDKFVEFRKKHFNLDIDEFPACVNCEARYQLLRFFLVKDVVNKILRTVGIKR